MAIGTLNVTKLNVSTPSFLATCTALIPKLETLLETFPTSPAIHKQIRNVILCLLRHLVSATPPTSEFEVDGVLILIRGLFLVSSVMGQLNGKASATAVRYFLTLGRSKDASVSTSITPTDLQIGRLLEMVRGLGTLLLSIEAQPLHMMIATELPLISRPDVAVEIFAHNVAMAYMLLYLEGDRVLLDYTGTYLAELLSPNVYESLRRLYSLDSPDRLQGASFFNSFLPSFRTICRHMHLDVTPLQGEPKARWKHFQYYIAYLLYQKGVYLDETDLAINQTAVGESGRNMQAYTQSILQKFSMDVLTVPTLLSMMEMQSPFCLLVSPIKHLFEFTLIFGGRRWCAETLNRTYRLVSEMLVRVSQYAGSRPLFVEAILTQYVFTLVLLITLGDCGKLCLNEKLPKIVANLPLKLPEASSSCAQMQECLARDCETLLTCLKGMALDTSAIIPLQKELNFLLRCATTSAAITALSSGRLFEQSISLGIFFLVTRTPPVQLADQNTWLQLLTYSEAYNYNAFLNSIREIQHLIGQMLRSSNQALSASFRHILHGYCAPLIVQMIGARFLLIAHADGESLGQSLFDMPVSVLRALLESSFLSLVSRRRLLSRVYGLMAYGYMLLKQCIVAQYYAQKYCDILTLERDDYFVLVADEALLSLAQNLGFGAMASAEVEDVQSAEDLRLSDLGGQSVANPEAYSSFQLLINEKKLFLTQLALSSMTENYQTLIFGCKAVEKITMRLLTFEGAKGLLISLFRNVDLYSFLLGAILLAELLSCDVNRLYGMIAFPLTREVRMDLLTVFMPILERLLGPFTTSNITDGLLESHMSPEGVSVSHFAAWILHNVRMAIETLGAGVQVPVQARLLLVQSSLYDTPINIPTSISVVDPLVISGTQQLLKGEQHLIPMACIDKFVECPFHCNGETDLNMSQHLIQRSLKQCLCVKCAFAACDTVPASDSIAMACTGDPFDRRVYEAKEVIIDALRDSCLSSHADLGIVLALEDVSVFIPGSIPLQTALVEQIQPGLSELIQCIRNHIVIYLEQVGSLSVASTLAALSGNTIQSLLLSQAAALQILGHTEMEQKDLIKSLQVADKQLVYTLETLIPSVVGAWKNVFQQGLNIPNQMNPIGIHLQEFVSFLLTDMHNSGSHDEMYQLCLRMGQLISLASDSPSLDAFIVILTVLQGITARFLNINAPSMSNCKPLVEGLRSTIYDLYGLRYLTYTIPTVLLITQAVFSDSESRRLFSTGIEKLSALRAWVNEFTLEKVHLLLSRLKGLVSEETHLAIYGMVSGSFPSLRPLPPPSTIVLQLDPILYRIPFEHSALILSNIPVSRIRGSTSTMTTGTNKFVVDPIGDLAKTQTRLRTVLAEIPGEWDGIIGKCAQSAISVLKECSEGTFLFAGHGMGEDVLPLNTVAAMERLPTCLLMGCSSLTHIPVGRAFTFGTYPYYRVAPLLIGTLWDVVSGELDTFTAEFLKCWTQGGISVYAALQVAARHCRLRGLVGASIIIIGDPQRTF
ncbi:Separase [Giardia muris]|uniref:separase n=1 Tax=Giardia muris TaxID=5742 RepID=A0A4Z1TB64_GIAMU|nr:Separase [Giardia muris]|eukprot:TNJ30487.1 Separase [Giardia muris]